MAADAPLAASARAPSSASYAADRAEAKLRFELAPLMKRSVIGFIGLASFPTEQAGSRRHRLKRYVLFRKSRSVPATWQRSDLCACNFGKTDITSLGGAPSGRLAIICSQPSVSQCRTVEVRRSRDFPVTQEADHAYSAANPRATSIFIRPPTRLHFEFVQSRPGCGERASGCVCSTQR